MEAHNPQQSEAQQSGAEQSQKGLTRLVVRAFCEVFDQAQPDDDELARRREGFAPITVSEEPVVHDVASFLESLRIRIDDPPRVKKATAMLKKSGFQLYNDIARDHVVGVVKSQTDQSLVYACRIAADGSFACCTQNLNHCGGLRGKACKHILVLLIGLVQSSKLDPSTVDGWLRSHRKSSPKLDKDLMADVFLKYRSAEAGEVDWRPTETMPEDFYAY